ncbi:GntR family transcriptional regulator [Marinomonas alcarazii]|uniref:GntR family transcriptional regulator n=1 Tax=Marinomonas alcarazii TaxID=491949 RepID=A0A318UUF1_9GAMM|nr:UTRA domain-containing protein [Marinomonas alcarazii]PYF79523.1 GntR family transcriptional regulator [Marinomonas alcarazii]
MSLKHYRHLQEHFHSLIRNKVLEAGSKLPSEREIGEQFKLTRVTVRQALQSLEMEGMVYRQNRRGWFVSPPAVVYDPAAHLSFNIFVTEQGYTPHTEKLQQTLVAADSEVATKMNLAVGTPVLFLHRRRYIDNRPVLIEKMYINTTLLPGIEEEDLTQSLSQLLARKYQMSYRDMDLSFKATSLPEEATSALGITAGQSGLNIERINYTQDKQVLEIDYEYWRHDAVTIQIAIRD